MASKKAPAKKAPAKKAAPANKAVQAKNASSKKSSGKTRGTDGSGNPIDLEKNALESYWKERGRAERAVSEGNTRELKVAIRNTRDLLRNKGVTSVNSYADGSRLVKNVEKYLPMPAAPNRARGNSGGVGGRGLRGFFGGGLNNRGK